MPRIAVNVRYVDDLPKALMNLRDVPDELIYRGWKPAEDLVLRQVVAEGADAEAHERIAPRQHQKVYERRLLGVQSCGTEATHSRAT